MVSDDEWQATLTRRLGLAVVVSLVLHIGILVLVGWVRLPRHGERPLTSVEISLASLPTLPEKAAEPQKSQPVKKEVEPPKPIQQAKPIAHSKASTPPKPVELPKSIEPPKSALPVKAAPVSLPPVAAVPVPPPVTPAKSSNDLMRDIMKDIELPPDAPKRGDISPEDKPRKSPVMKLPDVPVVTEAKETMHKKLVASAQSSSLTEDGAKELDEELKKIKALEVPKTAPPVDMMPTKPVPQVEAKAQSAKAIDTALKVPGMAPGSNAYLAIVRQRISNAWNAPPMDLTSHAYVVVVQFRLHKNGSVTGVTIEQSSGNEYYDLAGKRAVLSANPLPVFPADVTDLYFDAHFTFTVGEPQG
ncbi:MAG: cell envelope integrity protein TolA [Nitrospira sp.]|nr:cell envelope integrity protein TolA [Nitrospira sp.]